MKKSEINKKNLRNFGLALGLVLIIFGTRLFFKHHNSTFLYLAGAGILFVISGLILPFILKPIYVVFNKIGSFVFGCLIINILLSLFFYIVIVPTGLFIRIAGKDLLGLKIDKDMGSYWIKRERKTIDQKQYEKQF